MTIVLDTCMYTTVAACGCLSDGKHSKHTVQSDGGEGGQTSPSEEPKRQGEWPRRPPWLPLQLQLAMHARIINPGPGLPVRRSVDLWQLHVRPEGTSKEATPFPCEETKQTPINVQLTPSSLLLVVARKKRRDAARELASISSIHCIEGSCSAALYYCAAALLVVVLFGK